MGGFEPSQHSSILCAPTIRQPRPTMTFQSYGKLIYSPRSHLRDSKRWLVLMADNELVAYYSCLFRREFPWLPKLQRPVWGAHISVIRDEVVPNSKLWGLRKNAIIPFDFEPGVEDNGEYFWLKVKCDELAAIRVAYGLSPLPQFDFHLTIGRTTGG